MATTTTPPPATVPAPGGPVSLSTVQQQNASPTTDSLMTAGQINDYVKGLTDEQISNPSTQDLTTLSKSIEQLPYKQAQSVLSSFPSSLQSSINDQISPPSAAAGSSNPLLSSGQFDPLALQTLMSSVLAPYLKQTGALQNNAAGEYGSAMNAALANYNGPGKAALSGDAAANQALISQSQNSAQNMVAAAPAYDNLISQLQQATGAASLYKGEAERDVAYGQDQQLALATSPSTNSTTGAPASSSTTAATTAAANAVNQILSQVQPATTSSSSGLLPSQTLGQQ